MAYTTTGSDYKYLHATRIGIARVKHLADLLVMILKSIFILASIVCDIALGQLQDSPIHHEETKAALNNKCTCRNMINKEIIASVDRCLHALKLEVLHPPECTDIDVMKVSISKYHSLSTESCECGAKLTKDLIGMLQSCVQALSDAAGCSTTGPPITPSTTVSVSPTTTIPVGPTASPTKTPTLPSSCSEIRKKHPKKKSGNYKIQTKDGKIRTVYCKMGKLCGVVGGWTRIGIFNAKKMSCPTGFKLYKRGSEKGCGRPSTKTASCQSMTFPVGFNYQRVCGAVFGHQYGHTSALYKGAGTIDGPYVDGISITHGSPRKHVWTFMSSFSAIEAKYSKLNCPCAKGSLQKSPSFVGNDYFCESGLHTRWKNKYYTVLFKDKLWNRLNYGKAEVKCRRKGLPWFSKVLKGGITNDDMELRVCGTGGTNTKDAPFFYYDIFVK